MTRLAFALAAALSISATPAFAASSALDASQLPAELRNAPLQRVSTGGLMRLDQNGSLVRAPAATVPRIENAGSVTQPDSAAQTTEPGRQADDIRSGR